MIVRGALQSRPIRNSTTTPLTLEQLNDTLSPSTMAGESVTPERSKSVATFYRGANIIGDDVGKMPMQQFTRFGRSIQQVVPDPMTHNLAYLLEVSPNQWGWTPFQFKKAIIDWQIHHGNALVWRPPVWPPQLLILPANRSKPVFDQDGYLWYEHRFSNHRVEYVPSVEVLHLLINPDETGFWGRGVVKYARETIGKQLGAHQLQARNYGKGMKSYAYIQTPGSLDKDGRNKIRDAYEEALEAYGLAVFDNKITKFEPIQMKLTDAQFLEQINATNEDIANFLGMPLHMLNMGKQAYNSNDQKFGEYLQGTLDAYLVPFEQAARIKWLPLEEQGRSYFRFIRESLLRMDPKARAEMNEVLLRSLQRTPNELREKDDLSADPSPDSDKLWVTSNYVPAGGAVDEEE